jgi:hypothetical protein
MYFPSFLNVIYLLSISTLFLILIFSYILCLPLALPVDSSDDDCPAIRPSLDGELFNDDDRSNMWPHMDFDAISRRATPTSWTPLQSAHLAALGQAVPLSVHSSGMSSEPAVFEAGSSSATPLGNVHSDAPADVYGSAPIPALPVRDMLNNLPSGTYIFPLLIYLFSSYVYLNRVFYL